MGIFNKTANKKNSDSTWTKRTLPEPVYYVFSPHDDTVCVGIDVVVQKDNDRLVISWWDTTHERCMLASNIIYNSDFFAFKRIDSEGGGLYFFIPMDLDIYNMRVKSFLISGGEFDNKEDMIKAFLESTNC